MNCEASQPISNTAQAIRSALNIFVFTVISTIMLTAGCRPLVIGNGVFAIGCYTLIDKNVSQHSHLSEVNGMGVLIVPGRLIIGYAEVATLWCCEVEDNLYARVGRSEVFVGAAADREAERMAQAAMERALSNKGNESP